MTLGWFLIKIKNVQHLMASEKTEAVKRCSAVKGCLKILQNLQENTYCARVPQACNFIKKETMAQVFSCKFCESFKNAYFYRKPLVAVSEKK